MARKSGVVFRLASLGLVGYLMFKMVSGIGFNDGNLNSLDEVNKRLNNRPVMTQTEHKQRKRYAVVINGDTSRLHQGNVTEAYQSLKHLGFEDENIFLLTSNYPRDDDGKSITSKGTEKGLRRVFDYLNNVVDDNDLVLIYTTGHGGTEKGQSTLYLDDKQMPASDLKGLVEKVRAGDYVVVSDQCYSGGIAKTLSELKGRVASFSSTDSNHSTYCESFARPFWQSFRNGEADKNGDGTTSLEEAFKYASRNHKENIGLLHKIFGTNRDCQEYRTKESPNQLE